MGQKAKQRKVYVTVIRTLEGGYAQETKLLMFYDLNVPFGVSQAEIQKTLSFLSERV